MGFIGTDKSGEDNATWFPTAPTAEQEPQEDVVTTHNVYYNSEGIACCEGVQGD